MDILRQASKVGTAHMTASCSQCFMEGEYIAFLQVIQCVSYFFLGLCGKKKIQEGRAFNQASFVLGQVRDLAESQWDVPRPSQFTSNHQYSL